MKLLSLLLAVTSLLLISSCQGKTKASENRPPTPVHAVPVKLFTPQSGERYSASLVPARQLTLSFRVPGFVVSIYNGKQGARLEPGDVIPAGATLAVLRPKDYDDQVLQAKGQLESARKNIETAQAMLAEAEAAFTKADTGWKRADALFQSKSLTAPDWEAAKAQREMALAHVHSARSQIEGATGQEGAATAALSSVELAKRDSVLNAPWTARLLQRSVEIGSLISPGQPVFTLADTSTVKAVFGVPDMAVVDLKRSDRIYLTLEAVPGRFTATVTSIAPAADPATRLFLVEAALPNANQALRPGMIATVYLRAPAGTQPVTVVPFSSIVRGKGESTGFSVMVVRMNRAQSQAVTLGTTYGDQIAVTGVTPGELVINSGGSLIGEGDPVEVIQ